MTGVQNMNQCSLVMNMKFLKAKLSIAKLAHHGAITTDTCNPAWKLNTLLIKSVAKKAEKEGMSKDEIAVHQVDCWNHLRNVWIGALNKELSKYLSGVLIGDLEHIDPMFCVNTNVDCSLRSIDHQNAAFFTLCLMRAVSTPIFKLKG